MTKEELEKEAEEYAGNTYEMCSYSSLPYASDRRARQQAFLAGAEPREKRIEELEKENAELKEDNSEWEKASDKWKSVYEITNNQLTKAKAILREFVDWANWQGSNCPSFKSIQEKAEQFLNGEVEK